jgi:hypothetical protein
MSFSQNIYKMLLHWDEFQQDTDFVLESDAMACRGKQMGAHESILRIGDTF